MLSTFPTTLQWQFSLDQWDSLCEEIAQSYGAFLGEGTVYSEIQFAPDPEQFPLEQSETEGTTEKFRLVIATGGWLLCTFQGSDRPRGQVALTVDGEVIAQWIDQQPWSLPELSEPSSDPPSLSPLVMQRLLQRWFASPEMAAEVLACPVPAVDRAWERVHHGLIYRLVQGLEELPQAIQWALGEARSLLDVDRLLIYQFQVRLQSVKLWRRSEILPETLRGDHPWDTPQWQELRDGVTYEACRDQTIQPVLYGERDRGILGVNDRGIGQPGRIVDRGTEGGREGDGRSPLAQAQLAVPISWRSATGPEPWGLLVAQMVDRPRQWSDLEETWLTRLAQILTLGIHYGQVEASGKQNQQKMEQTLHDQGEALQDALSQAQTATHAKSEFLAAVSHELRTPLTCVIGLSDTLLRWSSENLSLKQREYLHTIHSSGEHLKQLVDDILEVTQVGSGVASLQVQGFSIGQLLLQSIAHIQDVSPTGRREIDREVQISPAEDEFWGDRQRVQQIVMNLLSNAVKFTPESGRVMVRAWLENQGLLIQVEDTGIGISAEQIPSLFENFHQVDGAYQRSYGGLGMGLALTKQLVDLHGGTIEVNSVPHQGSIFTVWLPDQRDRDLVDTAVAVAGQPNPEPSRWTKKEVVLIDGSNERASILCNLLIADGHDVVWLEDGGMAIAQLDTIRPDLVVLSLDWQAASRDGRDVVLGGSGRPYFWEQLGILPELRQRAGQRVKILTLGDEEIREGVHQWLTHWQSAATGVTLGDRPLIDAHLCQYDEPQTFLETVTGLFGFGPVPIPLGTAHFSDDDGIEVAADSQTGEEIATVEEMAEE